MGCPKSGVIHHQVERLPTVDIFPLTDTYELCLVSECRPMLGKTILSVPAGFMDKENEIPLQTAKRELQEELGITANQWEKLQTVELGNSVIHAKAHFFLAKDLTFGAPSPEEDERITLVKLPLSEAVQKVMAGEISGVCSMTGILLLDRLRREKKL